MSVPHFFITATAEFIATHQLLSGSQPVLVAVSGGADSMVLLQVMAQLAHPFAVAHCNFELRGEASDGDAAFVQAYCQARNIPFHQIRFDTRAYAAAQKQSIEEAARHLRYDWFRELCSQYQYSAIATAHHADDSIETAFMNFCKGTGISGLHGILPKAGGIIRPLLWASRAHIEAYAQEQGISWREDASNQQTDYTRNYFRHEVLPQIEKIIPSFRKNMTANIRRFGEQEWLYKQQINMLQPKLAEQRGAEWYIPVRKLKQYPVAETLLFEILKAFDFTPGQSAEAIKLMEAPSGKWMVSPTHRLLKNREFLIISRLATETAGWVVIEPGMQQVTFPDGQLTIDTLSTANLDEAGPNVLLADAQQITWPLVLRRRKDGDYFYPMGMNHKKKKIARFLIDQKVSLNDKEKVWVLESNSRIVWVAGMRADERFKVTPHSRQVLKISLHKG
jgi:tRNA(Ile)-lysidine synthase